MENNNSPAPYSLIPLSSNEPLFEWDIVSDALFMTQGLYKSLNLPSPPPTMADFYKLLTADAATELGALRKNILLGKDPAASECSYLCNGFWVQEYMLVLSRNSEGHATRVIGKMDAVPVGPAHAGLGFSVGIQDLAGSGVWIYDVKERKIWLDQTCGKLLGLGGNIANPMPITQSFRDIHPAERAALQRHYKIFCEGLFFGNTITDIVRIKQADGTFATALLRASAVERNEAGKAVLVAGLLSMGAPVSANSPFCKDDSRFHALNNMGGGQWNWDTKADKIYFCPRYLEMLGYRDEENPMPANAWRKLIHPEDASRVIDAQKSIMTSPQNGDTFEYTYRMKSASGAWAWIFDRGYVIWRDKLGRAGHIIGSITNITTAQAERDRLEDLVRHDTLTGLRSRAFCNLEIEHIEQNGIRPVCVISMDITGLKMINDNLGHAVGDELLIIAASLLRGGLRKTDCVGRIGGDEYLALLPNCNLAKGKKLVEFIRARFDNYNKNHGMMPVFASIGLACGISRNERLSEIMSRADEAMYEDKKSQRKDAHAAIRKWILARTGKEPVADDRLADE
ncbi:MAG: sensor domain-containing diguanylate cyclase [Desulfovibrio sp.]